MSETPSRPPGLSTREISSMTSALSVERLITQLEMTTSTESAGSGICSIRPLRKIGVSDPGVGGVLARQREHLVGHVEPVREAGRPDALGRQDDVDSAAGTQVEHGLALPELGDRRRVAASERGEGGSVRKLAALLDDVERRAEVLACASPSQQAPLPQPHPDPSATAIAASAYLRLTSSRKESDVVIEAPPLGRARGRRARRGACPPRA